MNASTYTSDKGHFFLLSIIDSDTEETILTFDKRFTSEQEIEIFKKGKMFKAIFKAVQK